MRISLALIVCLLASLPATSESLDFAIYRLSGEGRDLITQGRVDYTVDEIDVIEWGSLDGHPAWNKSLRLKEGFSIGILVIQNAPTDAFGLWIRNERHPKGFSWEWFYREDGDIFRKLQGEGRVRAIRAQYADGLEIQSVEFLTDVTMRFMEDVTVETDKKTHEVVVSTGSFLRVAP